MINTVIFDLDGTLLYTLEDLTDSVNFALCKHDFSKCTVEQIRTYVGNGVRKLLERAMPLSDENPSFDECLSDFKKHYKENMYNKTAPYAGVIELLKELKNKRYKTAVVSNKFDTAVKDLCQKYFDGLIDIAVGESDSVKKKPAPDSVLEVMRQLGSKAENCVYVGDSEVDIKTAKNAGIPCISVDWGYKERDFLVLHGARCIVSTPAAVSDELYKF